MKTFEIDNEQQNAVFVAKIDELTTRIKYLEEKFYNMNFAELVLTEREKVLLSQQEQTTEATKRIESLKFFLEELRSNSQDRQDAIYAYLAKKSKIGVRKLKQIFDVVRRFR